MQIYKGTPWVVEHAKTHLTIHFDYWIKGFFTVKHELKQCSVSFSRVIFLTNLITDSFEKVCQSGCTGFAL